MDKAELAYRNNLIIELFCEGWAKRKIAKSFGISTSVVRTVLKNRKIGNSYRLK